jgi:hypothetical protein
LGYQTLVSVSSAQEHTPTRIGAAMAGCYVEGF